MELKKRLEQLGEDVKRYELSLEDAFPGIFKE
jgi:hypothetical protein